MAKRLFVIFTVCALILVMGVGCGKKDADLPGIDLTQPGEEAPKTEERAPSDISHIVDYPVVETLDADEGDYVLAPIAGAMSEKSGAKIYYGAILAEKGEKDSKLKRLSGGLEAVANAVIVPIRSGEKAEVGDIVLSWWQSGSGMQRAIVIGGTEDKPTVMYLDIDYDNPSGAGKKEDTLDPNTFHVLEDEDIGTAAACLDEGERVLIRVVGMADGKILGLGFASTMVSYDEDKCKFIPTVPEVEVGDTVYVPIIGTFDSAVVKSIDEKIGRVYVEYDFAGQAEEAAIAFGNVLTELK